MKALTRVVLGLGVAMALDGLSKVWAEQTLELYQPVPLAGDFFRFTLGYNTGVAFGMFANGGSGPLIVTGFVILGLTIWFWRALQSGQFPAPAGWPIGLLLGGAIANFVDRLIDGRVTDFLDAGVGATRWPTFNLADSFIIVGMVWLLFINQGERHRLKEAEPVEESSPPNDLQ
ncbi:MAG: lipoprotein signal peptidase [Chloroflexota bacterium]|nr:MAG: lipoprotein signal peptidase [Chloroflexota bacterium]